MKEGDIIIIHDVGGYYHASHSMYNSRLLPPVIGYKLIGNKIKFRTLQKGKVMKDMLS